MTQEYSVHLRHFIYVHLHEVHQVFKTSVTHSDKTCHKRLKIIFRIVDVKYAETLSFKMMYHLS